MTFSKGYSLLVGEVKKIRPEPTLKNGSLRPSEIRVATSVFHPRTGEGTEAEAEAHNFALAIVRAETAYLYELCKNSFVNFCATN